MAWTQNIEKKLKAKDLRELVLFLDIELDWYSDHAMGSQQAEILNNNFLWLQTEQRYAFQ